MTTTPLGLAWVVPLLVSTSLLAAAPADYRQFPSGQAVSAHQLPEAICRGWVEVRTTTPAQVAFWDLLLTVERDSRLLLGCNQDYIYALAISGGFDNGNQAVTPGMVSLWSHFGGNGDSPMIYDFSAGALVKMFASAGQPNDAGLESLAHVQKSQPGSLGLGGAEALTSAPGGRMFRMFPEVMAIKRASRHLSDYGLRTAAQFARALSERDTGLLAALLAPSLFEEETSAAPSAVKPSPKRVAFAERLVAINDYEPVASASGLRELGNLQYEMRSSRQAFRISLQLAEGSLYVKRLDPVP